MRVGHARRLGDGALTGTTVILPDPAGAVAGVDVRGGGPGTRETDALDPRTLVDRVHAVVLSGGSAYGLAAATGVMDTLGAAGVGFPVGGPGEVVPIVPAAVVFDLGRGGDFRARPDAALGAEALAAATDSWADGVVGAGTGTLVGGLKGGVGTATETTDAGEVTALVVVNAAGSAVDPRTGELWAARHLTAADRTPPPLPDDRSGLLERLAAAAAPPTLNTTIGVVWTDATLTVAQCSKLAAVGHDGLARAIRPVHGMTDGDTLFGLATTTRPAPDLAGLQALLTAGADAVTRAVGNAVLAAESVGGFRCYADVVADAERSGAGPGRTDG
ncbi:P1 family peptidase [Actinomycetospora corticicola]|uniref:L-aminopeptidase/D-esterase-like protein n=1 Tax=Actinomycetospora corticicola TaxID=663602 RepID=A0A7Y9J9C4_9PSEU|nr:P1 family peptidase [Actinomycetospora corticicola]NYD39279.1 L-aminopeptidase/D-esterase-like protein [Actinomycetospora corticicola]